MAEEGIGRDLAAYEGEYEDFEEQYEDMDDADPIDFRPSLADEQKIGFFSLDRATQTENTEVIDLKEMTEVIEQLLEDVDKMKRDINFAKNVLQADFEAKLQKKSIELYQRVNEKISEIERMHGERVNTVRRAFKQQLADAIARMSSYYAKNFDQKLKRERTKKDMDKGKWEEKIKELQATIQRNESVITMLQMQLEQTQRQAEEAEAMSYKSKSPSINVEAEELREEVTELKKKIRRLEDALDTKEETTNELTKEMEKLQDSLERERILTEQLRHERDELQQSAEQDKASSRHQATQMESQRLSMEQQMADKLKQARQELIEQSRREMEELQEQERFKMKQLMDEKKLLEQMLAKERAKAQEKSKEALDMEKAQKLEEKLRAEVAKLKKEIERVHRTWEKKFAILQQSLHALKDESYLRQTMQRQAAQLHQASISYAMDTPVGIMPHKPQPTVPPSSITTKRPLPDISRGAKSPADFISYTVSAPSGRGTALFSMDENQVLSDNEPDLPPDMVPLPSPPPRNPQDCGEDSRPSTRSHVVVLPSVQAQ